MRGELNHTCFIFLGKHVCDVHLFSFSFIKRNNHPSSVTCDDEGNSVVIVDVTVIVGDTDDDGELCVTAAISVVASDVTVIVVDENNVGTVFAVVIVFAE